MMKQKSDIKEHRCLLVGKAETSLLTSEIIRIAVSLELIPGIVCKKAISCS